MIWAACQRWASRSFRLISVIVFSHVDSAAPEPFAANRVFHSQKASKACPGHPGQPFGQSLCKSKVDSVATKARFPDHIGYSHLMLTHEPGKMATDHQ